MHSQCTCLFSHPFPQLLHITCKQTMTKTDSKATGTKSTKKPTFAKQPSKKKTTNKTDALATYSFRHASDISISVSQQQISIKCKVFGIPRPQYHCFARSNKNSSASRKVNVYNTSNYERDSFKNAVQVALTSAGKTPPFQWFGTDSTDCNNPMDLKVWFYFPRPKSHYSLDTSTKKLTLSPLAPVYVTKTPDIDNCLKLVMDAMQGVLFPDDKCICSLASYKLWHPTAMVWEENQEKLGCILFKLTQYKLGTTEKGCKCSICSMAMKKQEK
jgi:Holliday junction resolvase RusA-like endonuclease